MLLLCRFFFVCVFLLFGSRYSVVTAAAVAILFSLLFQFPLPVFVYELLEYENLICSLLFVVLLLFCAVVTNQEYTTNYYKR